MCVCVCPLYVMRLPPTVSRISWGAGLAGLAVLNMSANIFRACGWLYSWENDDAGSEF